MKTLYEIRKGEETPLMTSGDLQKLEQFKTILEQKEKMEKLEDPKYKVSKYLIKYLGKGADTAALIKRQKAERECKQGRITKDELNAIIEEIDQVTKSINGKLWDCSEALNEKYFTVLLKWKLGLILADYIRDNPDCAYFGERFCSIQIDFKKPPDFMQQVMPRYKMYLEYINAGGRKAFLN